MKTYTQKDITQILGLKRTAVQQWLDRGFVAPSVESASGHGTRNLWSRGDIIDLAVFQTLLEHGFSREEASCFVKEREVVRGDGQIGRRLEESADLEWEEMIGLEVFAVQLTTREGVRNLLVEANDGDIFKALGWVKSGVLAIKAVNITETKKATMALL